MAFWVFSLLCVFAADGTWLNTGGGSWTNTANWSGGIVAGGQGATARFSTLALASNVTVSLDGARTVGALVFDDQASTKHVWTLGTGSGGPLSMETTSGVPSISNNVGATIAAAVAGVQGFTKSGSGTLVLSGSNNCSGTVTVSAGLLGVKHGQALGGASVVINNNNGAILQLDGGIVVSGRALVDYNTQSGANGLQSGPSSNVWTGPITLGMSGARVGAAVGGVLNLTGVVDDGGRSYDLRIRGEQANPPGVVLLSATNSYTGNTLINVGMLRLGDPFALPPGTIIQLGIGVGGSCALDLAGFSPLVSGLADMPSQVYYGYVTNSSTVRSILTISNSSACSYSGNIAGNIALTKIGPATLSLLGTNSSPAPVIVAEGRLGGAGVLSGPVTVRNGASIAPGGTGLGILLLSNTLTLYPDSTTMVRIDKNNAQSCDQISGITSLSLGGTLQVNNIGSVPLAAGDSFRIFSAANGVGQFTSVVPTHPNGDTALEWDTGVVAATGLLVIRSNGTPSSVVSLSVSNMTGMTVTCDSTGLYSVTSSSPRWAFCGSLGSLAYNLASNSGVDRIGGYSELTFFYTNSVGQFAGIRIYSNQPVALFSQTCLESSANNLTFPRLTTYPPNLYHVGFAGTFGVYSFNTLAGDSPWLFFDTNYNAFMISPAANFMIASDVRGVDGTLSCGIDAGITTLPAGFTHRSVLVVQNGINRTFETWGNALTGLSGKSRPGNDAALELNKLGYWTDNGAVYYYAYDSSKGYAGTLMAVRDEFAAKGVPLGYLQLDSWWYPKSYLATWQGGPTNSRGGIYLYQADTQLFPDGLGAFQQQLALPLVTHARWIDGSSPYRTNYAISKNAPVDYDYWTNLMSSIAAAGVTTYEQDWLDNNCLPLMNLSDPPAFMDFMAAAAVSNRLNMQYCMALPRHYLQSSLYNNLLTIRVGGDDFTAGKWNQTLYDARLASAVGAWPWVDVFMSSEERNLLLATLSAGMLGTGDALGAVNAANLGRAVRSDSVIVKPDQPLLPLDRIYAEDAQGRNLPMIAATSTDHNGLKAAYVFSYARQATNAATSFAPGDLGFAGDCWVYDYFSHVGAKVVAGGSYAFSTTTAEVNAGGSYFVVVPVGPSGIAFLGDTNKYVTLGKKRITALSDSGTLETTVQFAAGETNLSVAGFAPSTPYIWAKEGAVGAVHYDASSGWFSANVTPGPSSVTTLQMTLRPVLHTESNPGMLRLLWPAVTGTVLERATKLGESADWAPATNAVSTADGRFIVEMQTDGGPAFFRIRQ